MLIANNSPSKKMKSAEYIALSACTMTLTALGIDVMLPAFAEVRLHFGLDGDSTETAQIISLFFMGQVAQIIFGTLSDRFGRLPIMRIGFPLYIIGGIAAAFAPSMETMLAARFVAGMGASAVFMITVAGVRDRFVGNDMARIMSMVFTIFLFTPVLAPFLGMAILSVSSWRTVFLSAPLFGIVVFIWSFRLEESHPTDKRVPLRWQTFRNAAVMVLTNRRFLRYTTITTLLFTGLSSWVASSERIVSEIYGKPELFAWIFASIRLLMSLTTLMNVRLTTMFGARLTIKGLLISYTCAGVILLLLTAWQGDPPNITSFFILIALLLSINLAVEPNSSALALEPMGDMTGFASSVYGTTFFFVGATLGTIPSSLMVEGIYPLVISMLGIGVITTIIAFTDTD